MLLCCLRCNVEASCHKHFVIVSRHQQTPLLSSDKCHQSATVRRSRVYCTWRQNRSQHTMEPDISWQSWFVPTTPAFDAPIRGSPSEYCHNVWYEKLEWYGYSMVKQFWRYVYLFWQNSRTWRTDRRTDTAWWHRLHLHSNHAALRLIWQHQFTTFTDYFWQRKTLFNPQLTMLNSVLHCRWRVVRSQPRPLLFQVCHVTVVVMETMQLVLRQFKNF